MSRSTSSEFTTTPKVTLKIASPAAATRIIVSNKPDFSDPETLDVTDSGRYPWQVLEDGQENGQRTVYVRWQGEAFDPSLTATAGVLLDDNAPVVSNHRYVYENRVKGKRYRVWVAMRTVDPASGVKYMQFAPSKAHTFLVALLSGEGVRPHAPELHLGEDGRRRRQRLRVAEGRLPARAGPQGPRSLVEASTDETASPGVVWW